MNNLNIASLKLTLMSEYKIATRGLSDLQVASLAHDKQLITLAQFEDFDKKNAPQDDKPMINSKAELAAKIAELLNTNDSPQLDEQRIIELIKEHATPAPRLLEVKAYDAVQAVKVGFTHPAFDSSIELINMGVDVFFYGETGSGKSTTARKIAEALDRPFYSMGALMTKFETLGSMTPQAGYSPSIIRKWLESENGLLCIDEIDASNPNAITSVMSLFDRNGEMTFPDGKTLARTDKHQVIITGNTTGVGANAKYNSRMKLDDAFLTCFVRIEHGYNDELENYLGGIETATYARQFRDALVAKKMHGSIIAPRTIEQAGKIYDNDNLKHDMKKELLKHTFKQGLNEKDYASITNEIGVLV